MTGNRIDSLAVNYPYMGYCHTPQYASNPIGGGGVAAYNTPAFKAQQEALRQHDVVEISAKQDVEKKKGLSKGAKWAIGLGITGLACVGARYGLQNKIKKSYAKLSLSELPENIVFKKAANKDEALKFARETLKIKNIDESIGLEELNYINKNLTEVANAQKGKCVMPHSIKYFDKETIEALEFGQEGSASAGIEFTLGKNFGTLGINKKCFEHEYLDKTLKLCYFNKDGTARLKPGQPYKFSDNVFGRTDNEYSKLLEKYFNNPSDLCLEEKIKLIESYGAYRNNIANIRKGFKTGIKGLNDSGNVFLIPLQQDGHIIHHEMGHLQDFWRKKDSHISKPFITEINLRRDGLNILPTKAHKEFTTNKNIQETAGKVSDYAKSSIDEFIAETYAGLICGQKYSDDVMALYKKYNGPMPGVC